MRDALRGLFIGIGEDPDREGLRRTPERFEEAFRELTQGYGRNIEDVIGGALFATASRDPVFIGNIAFSALCEHHLLPFFGSVHIGYIPDGHVIGLSKIPRVVELYARRLQTQERLGRQICDALESALKPRGIAVMVEAEHLCMRMRGVEKKQATVTTRHLAGGAGEEAAKNLPIPSLRTA